MTNTQRECAGVRAGLFGIGCNLLLAGGKGTAAVLSGSVSVLADAANNLFDAVGSLASLIGFKLACKQEDREHPYGHGRLESLVSVVIALLVILAAVEFGKSSVGRILRPEVPESGPVCLLVLGASVAVKLAMALYYRRVARDTGSPVVKAQTFDSFSDAVMTLVILAALLLAPHTDFPVDGVMGLIVSAVVLLAGVRMAREVLSPLLGGRPAPELVAAITAEVMAQEHILGVHDLCIHEYGPQRLLASLHAEMPNSLSFDRAHEILTRAERAVRARFGVELVIHGDPVDVDDPKLQQVRYELKQLLRSVDPGLAYHDLRLEPDGDHTDVVFDLVVPYGAADTEAVRQQVAQGLQRIDPGYDPVIQCDRG